MLILAYANGFGVDLHQFSEWVLQTPGNGRRAAQGDVEIGQSARSIFRS